MIIQEECEYIIMLCNFKENGMPKCAQYWPINEGQAMSVDQVEILNLKVFFFPIYLINRLSIFRLNSRRLTPKRQAYGAQRSS